MLEYWGREFGESDPRGCFDVREVDFGAHHGRDVSNCNTQQNGKPPDNAAEEHGDQDDRPQGDDRGYGCLFDVVDRKSTRLNSSHVAISYAVSCLKKKTARQ